MLSLRPLVRQPEALALGCIRIPSAEPSAVRGSIVSMPAVRVFGRVMFDLLLLALELVLLPVRLLVTLLGGLLVVGGLVGLPAWLVQLMISLAGGKGGGGPLPAWEMCALLVVAVPVGIALIDLAGLGTRDGSEPSERIAQPVEPTAAGAAPKAADASHEQVETGRTDAMDAPHSLPRVELSRKTRSTRLTQHQLRVRRASKAVTRGRRLRRRGH